MQNRKILNAVLFAQSLDRKPVYTLEDAISVAGSIRTAYRRLNALESLGLAKYEHGNFILKTNVISQPASVLQRLVPSLVALNKARKFGRNYNESDIRFVLENIQNRFVTLDYKAYELTKYQTPLNLQMYIQDIDGTASFLKKNGFKEGQKGHIILLPEIGDFTNEIERVYLDCIANGERSTWDAIAIELLHEEKLSIRGLFSVQEIRKVEGDMPLFRPATLAE